MKELPSYSLPCNEAVAPAGGTHGAYVAINCLVIILQSAWHACTFSAYIVRHKQLLRDRVFLAASLCLPATFIRF